MKHNNIFNEFLRTVVNLNQTRIDRAESSSEAVINTIINHDEMNDIYISHSAQGSYGHRTIIKPLSGKEFDVDIVVFLKKQKNWEARDYLNKIKDILGENEIYKNKMISKNRCICIDYAGDFHIDIVPCIVETLYATTDNSLYYVCNRRENVFEQTNPDAYKNWIRQKNKTTQNNQLIKTIRLIKYLRDIKTTFSCKSILLTTLLARTIQDIDNESNYSDIATSLKTIISRLDDYLTSCQTMPTVTNPVQPSENFNRHWDQDKFSNFKSFISKYRGWIDDAYNEQDRVKSIEKWQRIFGEKFIAPPTKNNKSDSDSITINETYVDTYPIPHHCKLPYWAESHVVESFDMDISHRPNNSTTNFIRSVNSEKFSKQSSLRFEIKHPITEDSEIYWQVTNTGEEARAHGNLRGDFELGGKIKEETTSYKGYHFIEAFIVRNNLLVARSGKRIILVK